MQLLCCWPVGSKASTTQLEPGCLAAPSNTVSTGPVNGNECDLSRDASSAGGSGEAAVPAECQLALGQNCMHVEAEGSAHSWAAAHFDWALINGAHGHTQPAQHGSQGTGVYSRCSCMCMHHAHASAVPQHFAMLEVGGAQASQHECEVHAVDAAQQAARAHASGVGLSADCEGNAAAAVAAAALKLGSPAEPHTYLLRTLAVACAMGSPCSMPASCPSLSAGEGHPSSLHVACTSTGGDGLQDSASGYSSTCDVASSMQGASHAACTTHVLQTSHSSVSDETPLGLTSYVASSDSFRTAGHAARGSSSQASTTTMTAPEQPTFCVAGVSASSVSDAQTPRISTGNLSSGQFTVSRQNSGLPQHLASAASSQTHEQSAGGLLTTLGEWRCGGQDTRSQDHASGLRPNLIQGGIPPRATATAACMRKGSTMQSQITTVCQRQGDHAPDMEQQVAACNGMELSQATGPPPMVAAGRNSFGAPAAHASVSDTGGTQHSAPCDTPGTSHMQQPVWLLLREQPQQGAMSLCCALRTKSLPTRLTRAGMGELERGSNSGSSGSSNGSSRAALLPQLLQVALDVACGLEAMHRAGCVHGGVHAGSVVLLPQPAQQATACGGGAMCAAQPNLQQAQLCCPLGVPWVEAAEHQAQALHEREHAGECPSHVECGASCVEKRGVCDGGSWGGGGGEASAAGGGHVAPELHGGGPATKAGDMYAFGALMYELYAGVPPLSELPVALLKAVRTAGLRPVFDSNCPTAWKRLALRCMDASPGARPGAGRVVSELRAMVSECRAWDARAWPALMSQRHRAESSAAGGLAEAAAHAGDVIDVLEDLLRVDACGSSGSLRGGAGSGGLHDPAASGGPKTSHSSGRLPQAAAPSLLPVPSSQCHHTLPAREHWPQRRVPTATDLMRHPTEAGAALVHMPATSPPPPPPNTYSIMIHPPSTATSMPPPTTQPSHQARKQTPMLPLRRIGLPPRTPNIPTSRSLLSPADSGTQSAPGTGRPAGLQCMPRGLSFSSSPRRLSRLSLSSSGHGARAACFTGAGAGSSSLAACTVAEDPGDDASASLAHDEGLCSVGMGAQGDRCAAAAAAGDDVGTRLANDMRGSVGLHGSECDGVQGSGSAVAAIATAAVAAAAGEEGSGGAGGSPDAGCVGCGAAWPGGDDVQKEVRAMTCGGVAAAAAARQSAPESAGTPAAGATRTPPPQGPPLMAAFAAVFALSPSAPAGVPSAPLSAPTCDAAGAEPSFTATHRALVSAPAAAPLISPDVMHGFTFRPLVTQTRFECSPLRVGGRAGSTVAAGSCQERLPEQQRRASYDKMAQQSAVPPMTRHRSTLYLSGSGDDNPDAHNDMLRVPPTTSLKVQPCGQPDAPCLPQQQVLPPPHASSPITRSFPVSQSTADHVNPQPPQPPPAATPAGCPDIIPRAASRSCLSPALLASCATAQATHPPQQQQQQQQQPTTTTTTTSSNPAAAAASHLMALLYTAPTSNSTPNTSNADGAHSGPATAMCAVSSSTARQMLLPRSPTGSGPGTWPFPEGSTAAPGCTQMHYSALARSQTPHGWCRRQDAGPWSVDGRAQAAKLKAANLQARNVALGMVGESTSGIFHIELDDD